MKRDPQAGIALLLTVWLLAVLAVVSAEFVFSTRVKLAAERNARDLLEGYAHAQAGYRAALAALGGDLVNVSLDTSGRLLLHYRGREDAVPGAAQDHALGEGTYSWRIEDEEGKININNPSLTRQNLAELLESCGMEIGAERDTAIDSILDWRDANRNHRLNGAEEDYYRGLDPPYSCKDGRFDVPEELLLVRGISARCYRGGEQEGRARPGLADLVTTLGESVAQVNVNTAPQAVLELLRKERPPQPPRPPRLSAHFSVVAVGKARAGAPERAVRAVVARDVQGDRTSFQLVYWNDNYMPETMNQGAAPETLPGR